MLTKDRVVSEKFSTHAPEFAHSVAAGHCVYRGSIVAVCEDGTIVPAGSRNTTSPLVAAIGIARQGSDNREGSSSPSPIWVQKGCYALPFDHMPSWAAIGQDVYAIDDETVSLSDHDMSDHAPEQTEAADATTHNVASSAKRLRAGTLAGIEAGHAFVLIS
ncbi:hypothetical protein [Aristophania vespae]|uniref:hypothetical protein n=1 Tax=Aristophania vespae TaxID=2697033 RepID=UPI002351A208|nr:hypothetical protein [Aristophania vespae]UMM63818.1 hypothetical protein DM15PD_07950 [Aristophania vespae]